MEPYKTGFDKALFEADHFGYKRGCDEKYYHSWEDVKYEFGLTSYSCNERELAAGNMGRLLYENLCHVFGENGVAKYFPKEEEMEKPKPMLHFGMGSVMAAGVDGKKPDTIPSGVMTDEEVDALAAIL